MKNLKSDILCLAALCLTGCTTLVDSSRFALFVPSSAVTPIAEAETESNPFKKNDNKSAGTAADKSDSSAPAGKAGEQPIASVEDLPFDAETKKLITERLQELPDDPQLRAERLAIWKGLSPSEVERIIHVERLADSARKLQEEPESGGTTQTVSMETSLTGGDDAVRLIPNTEVGHSGHPERNPFASGTTIPTGGGDVVFVPRQVMLQNPVQHQAMTPTGPTTNQPVTFVPFDYSPPASAPGGAVFSPDGTTSSAAMNPVGTGLPGENPFQQQTVSVPPLPPAESVVMVPHAGNVQPNGNAGAPPNIVGTPTETNPFTNAAQMDAGQPAGTPNDPNSGGFVRNLTNAPQSLRNFGAILTRPFSGPNNEQANPQQYAALNGQPAGTLPENLMLNREVLLTQLISLTEQELSQLSPEQRHDYIQKNVYLRMLYMMSDQEERSLQYIPGLEPANQEFWQQLFWALSNYFDQQSIPDAQARASQTVTQLQAASQRLQEEANLELRNVNFCKEISSFGDYKKFPDDDYLPGEKVLIYAEVANFKSELTADARYKTLLKTTIEFYRVGDSGGPVATESIPPKEDFCRSYRRDFFNGYSLNIPDNLTPGQYHLRLRLEDQLSNKFATETIKFRVQ